MSMTKSELIEKMREKGASDALDLRTKAAANKYTNTEIIDREEAIPAFNGQKDYSTAPVGTPVKDGEQVYGLIQPYNAANYSGTPATLPAIWGLKHTKNPAKAKPYVQSQGTSGMYMKDECCLWTDGNVYVSKVDNNVYSPSDYADNWTVYTP